jgi:hypothetical protein
MNKLFGLIKICAVASIGASVALAGEESATFAVAGRVIFYGTPDYTQQDLDRRHMAPRRYG